MLSLSCSSSFHFDFATLKESLKSAEAVVSPTSSPASFNWRCDISLTSADIPYDRLTNGHLDNRENRKTRSESLYENKREKNFLSLFLSSHWSLYFTGRDAFEELRGLEGAFHSEKT